MTLIEFIEHIKHNSLKISVIYNNNIVYDNSIGSYKHWVNRSMYDYIGILEIRPSIQTKDYLFIILVNN